MEGLNISWSYVKAIKRFKDVNPEDGFRVGEKLWGLKGQ